MAVNKVILLGNLGQDPEIRSTSDGREIANFSIATQESWKDKSTGERKDKTEWHRVVVFSQGLVGIVKNYVKKGTKIYIEGALQTRKWTDNNGVDKYTTEIILQNFNSTLQILNRVDDNNHSPSYVDNQNNNSDPVASTINNSATKVIIDDEIPF
jgi:single-strand DNA-binding protein